MDVYSACMKRRSVRKFEQREVPLEVLKKLVDVARVGPSGANVQPIEYLIITDGALREKLFPCLHWAGYIATGNPKPGEEPAAYIVMLVNTNIKEANYQYDVGAAAENMMLCALENSLASCMMGAIQREVMRAILEIPDNYIIDIVIALGYPSEQPVMEDYKESVRYYRDAYGVIRVPKRRLRDIVKVNRF